jgi:hypothetical protein
VSADAHARTPKSPACPPALHHPRLPAGIASP